MRISNYVKLRKKSARIYNHIKEIFDTIIHPIKKTNKHQKPSQRVLLIILPVAIGDYIIIRNLLNHIRNSNLYQNYTIKIALSEINAQIAKHFDTENYDEIISIDWENKQNCYEILNSQCAHVIFHPLLSRFLTYDKIIEAITANEKVGLNYLYLYNFRCILKQTAKAYTQILKPRTESFFEFDLLKDVLEQFIQESIHINRSSVSTDFPKKNLPEKYATIFIDASWVLRKWSAENFAKTVKYINDVFDLPVVILGQDEACAIVIMQNVSKKNVNLTCQTNIIDLIKIICHSELLISNDTGAMHIGAASDTKTICISNGSKYGRFVPYDKDIYKNHSTVFPEKIYRNIHRSKYLNCKYKNDAFINIDDVDINKVFKQIDIFLKSENSVH